MSDPTIHPGPIHFSDEEDSKHPLSPVVARQHALLTMQITQQHATIADLVNQLVAINNLLLSTLVKITTRDAPP
jgi:hypothetical protein